MAVRMDPKDLWQRSQGVISQAVGRGTELLADRIEHYSTVAGDVGDVLREKGESQAADVVDMVAGGVQDAATYLRARDGAALWNDAQELARGRTWLLAGVGFVGGMAAARALRSANEMHRWEQPTQAKPYVQPQQYAQSETAFGETSGNGARYEERL